MKKTLLTGWLFCTGMGLQAQKSPCGSNPMYRQFDFWLGEWEAYGIKGQKAGDSKISIIPDSCVILEEWTSNGKQGGIACAGKSFNTFTVATGQWQQTWADNAGGTNEYLLGRFENNKIIYSSKPFPFSNDSMTVRKMTFLNLGTDKVRQLGEISKDNGATWSTEYDLEYRRKKK